MEHNYPICDVCLFFCLFFVFFFLLWKYTAIQNLSFVQRWNFIIWAMSWENLFKTYANNRCLDSIIPLVSISELSSLLLASVAAQAGLCLTLSETPNTGFLVTRLIFSRCQAKFSTRYRSCPIDVSQDIVISLYSDVNMSHVTRKSVFGISDQVRLKLAYSPTETS